MTRTGLVAAGCWASLVVAVVTVPARGGARPLVEERVALADEVGVAARNGDPHGPGEAPRGGTALRKWGSLGGVACVYGAATTYMYFAWYRGQPGQPEFRVGGDGWFGPDTYAGGADKVGHAWSTLALSRVTTEVLAWGGWERWKAGLLASSMTLGLLTAFEVKDGFHTEFSPGDTAFNALGAALNVAMVAHPPLDEVIDFRVEYFPSADYRGLLRGARPPPDPARPHQVSLNFVEDYSGQRFLLALHAHALPLVGRLRGARLIDLAVGYETRGYRPEPVEPAGRTRRLFVGVSLNVQGVLDLALAGRGGAAGIARRAGHLTFELVNPPYASAALVGVTRSAPP